MSKPAASSMVATVPSTRRREKPRRPRSAAASNKTEGLSLEMGATIIRRVLGGISSRDFRLSSSERCRTGWPSLRQRRSPARIHRGRAWSAISVRVATVERGLVLPPVRWAMAMTGESPRMKSTSGRGAESSIPRALAERDSRYWRLPSACNVSKASDDLPDPLTPVITVN